MAGHRLSAEAQLLPGAVCRLEYLNRLLPGMECGQAPAVRFPEQWERERRLRGKSNSSRNGGALSEAAFAGGLSLRLVDLPTVGAVFKGGAGFASGQSSGSGVISFAF